MTRTRKPTATERFFADYPEYIIDSLFENGCVPSFTARAEMGEWYSTLPYSDKTMNIIMRESVMFLRMLDGNDSNSTCPHLLFALTAKIANYLAVYKMRGNPRILSGVQLQQSSVNKIQARTAAEIKEQLDNCSYIRFLLKKQEAQRAVRSAGWHNRAAQMRREEEAREKYRLKCQVRSEFQIMQNIPRKSR